jgi:hypothetical protein
MSDQIGFHYQRYAAEQAAGDFLGKLEAIGNATGGNAGRRPTLVSIILDGENCWEYYPRSGLDFLRGLYRRLLDHPKVKTVRLCDYLQQYPATDKLGNLFPGSWIQHNFGIWIGHPECNLAWDQLHQTRQFLLQATRQKNRPPDQLAQAWQELYIAEGSDWFWWFGGHTSAQDALFDRLFRKHLQNVYTVLGEAPSSELSRPISQGHHPRFYTEPTGLLQVKVNGRRSYFEWINAGRHVCQTGQGTMNMAREGMVTDLYFGFDTERLLVRLDARGGPFREQLSEIDALRVVFLQPAGFELMVPKPADKRPAVQLFYNEIPVAESGAEAAADTLFELALPFRSLALATDDRIHFFIELQRGGQSIERIPHEGSIETTVPSPDYELIMWQA